MKSVICFAILCCGVIGTPLWAQCSLAESDGPSVTLAEADKELNQLYQQIRQHYKDDPQFLQQLRLAQRAWLQSRDADFVLQYPKHEEPGYYGSVFSQCAALFKVEQTRQRSAFLKRWLAGVPEGEVCAGSIKRQRPDLSN